MSAATATTASASSVFVSSFSGTPGRQGHVDSVKPRAVKYDRPAAVTWWCVPWIQ